jgi:short-subunit dehydrogenase
MAVTVAPTIVTGASSGIGRSLAVALARSGVPVGAVARRADLLAELAAEVRSSGGIVEAAAADVTDQAAVRAAFDQLTGTLGPPDRLIANAGFGESLPADHPDHVANVAHTLNVNFLGVVYAFAAVLPGMLARGSGHLVAVSSLAAYKGLPGAAAYCASKAAVSTYCESLRIELRGRVQVTCVHPGFVTTAMTSRNPGPMPLLMTADDAAGRILRALRRRPGVYDFPWAMRRLMGLSRWAPDGVIARQAVKASNTPGERRG